MGFFLSPQVSLVRAQGRFRSVVPQMLHGTYKGCILTPALGGLQGLLSTASGSAPSCTPMYRYVPTSTSRSRAGGGGAHLSPLPAH